MTGTGIKLSINRLCSLWGVAGSALVCPPLKAIGLLCLGALCQL